MSAHRDKSLNGFVLGHGTLYNPRAERMNGLFRWVGLVDEDGEWVNIRPYDKDHHWLETLGPGRLVFIPDRPIKLEKNV